MEHLKDYMSKTHFQEILSSLDYEHMTESDKRFIILLYDRFLEKNENMEFTINNYARLNDIDFFQSDYIFNSDFRKFITNK